MWCTSRRIGTVLSWVIMGWAFNNPNHKCSIPLKDLQFIEFFSGRARATLCMRSAGLRAARLDYMYFDGEGNNFYNILTDGGFSFLGKLPVETESNSNCLICWYMLVPFECTNAKVVHSKYLTSPSWWMCDPPWHEMLFMDSCQSGYEQACSMLSGWGHHENQCENG